MNPDVAHILEIITSHLERATIHVEAPTNQAQDNWQRHRVRWQARQGALIDLNHDIRAYLDAPKTNEDHPHQTPGDVNLDQVIAIIDERIDRAHNYAETPLPIGDLPHQFNRFGWQARLNELQGLRFDLTENFPQRDSPNTAPGDVGARDTF